MKKAEEERRQKYEQINKKYEENLADRKKKLELERIKEQQY